MTVFLLTFVFLLLMVAAMAVGVILSNKPIKGSCGGIQQLGMGGKCDICGGLPEDCEENNKAKRKSDEKPPKTAFYNAAD